MTSQSSKIHPELLRALSIHVKKTQRNQEKSKMTTSDWSKNGTDRWLT